ncbi:MAG: carboxypeptidase regulatory-like domain-containing protein [Clostridia bacterium]|nr:carboxypeptidase regulatory-like domain-containing protein [Clostridia bacterium]
MYEKTEAPLSALGTLLVRVSTAGGFLPVEGADVRLVGAAEENRSIRYLLTTDRSGLAERVSLPTPPKELSLSPGNVAGFSRYNLEVFKQGYYPVRYEDIPLFPGINSVQTVELIPLPLYRPEQYPPREELNFTEREPLFEEVE